MMYVMKLQTDLIVGAGLVIALLASIFTGGSVELQTTKVNMFKVSLDNYMRLLRYHLKVFRLTKNK